MKFESTGLDAFDIEALCWCYIRDLFRSDHFEQRCLHKQQSVCREVKVLVPSYFAGIVNTQQQNPQFFLCRWTKTT